MSERSTEQVWKMCKISSFKKGDYPALGMLCNKCHKKHYMSQCRSEGEQSQSQSHQAWQQAVMHVHTVQSQSYSLPLPHSNPSIDLPVVQYNSLKIVGVDSV